MNKIFAIARSLRCYRCGWLSLLPVVGIPFLVIAFSTWHQVRAEAGKEWNPAQRYAIAGYVLAWLGILVLIVNLGPVAAFYYLSTT